MGGGGAGSDFVNWQASGGDSTPGHYIISGGSISINNLQPGKYFVSIHGLVPGGGNDASYAMKLRINDVAKVLYVANHPDGTAPVSMSAIATVDNLGTLRLQDNGSNRDWPIKIITAYRVGD